MSAVEVDNNMHGGVPCAQCKFPVVWPKSTSVEDLSLAATAWRERGLASMFEIGRIVGLSGAQGKAFAFHISRPANQCHRCASKVSSGVSVCSNCKSINLNW